jgi:hypothetical protein
LLVEVNHCTDILKSVLDEAAVAGGCVRMSPREDCVGSGRVAAGFVG